MIEIENGIGDQLPGPMIGHVATAIDFADFDPYFRELFAIPKEVALVRVSPERKGRRMFQQQECVGSGAGLKRISLRDLNGIGLSVWKWRIETQCLYGSR